MLNSFTHDRAFREVVAIETARGPESMPRVIQLVGSVSGRESRPDYFYGYAVRYVSPAGEGCIKFWPGDEVRVALRNVYVIDGAVYYVAGWQGEAGGTGNIADDGYVVLHPYTEDQRFMPHRCVFLMSDETPA